MEGRYREVIDKCPVSEWKSTVEPVVFRNGKNFFIVLVRYFMWVVREYTLKTRGFNVW